MKKKVYLETFGCQMNVSDTERVAERLVAGGYEITGSETAADVVLLNTCSVREKAEHKLYTRVGQLRNSEAEKKQVIGVLGCVAQLEGETLFAGRNEIDFVLGTRAVGRVNTALEKVFGGARNYADLGEREENYDWSVAAEQRSSAAVAFLPIIEGCNKFCTYCIVPFSRGREKSLPADEIIRQVRHLRSQGVREVHLIGQNVNSYRPPSERGLETFPGATAFSRLLRAVATTGIERIKFNTSFPRDFHADIVDAINENENLCNWVHLPAQSGSDAVLKAMRRGHLIESYLKKIEYLKASPRRIALTTDLIVGFPGETDADFRETLKLADYCRFDAAYIFKYSPRPGTPAAAAADDVPEQVKTDRFRELENLIRFNQINIFNGYVNKTVEVLAERISAKNGDALTGHTTCQKVVNFEGSAEMLGQLVAVTVTEAKTNTLYGQIAC